MIRENIKHLALHTYSCCISGQSSIITISSSTYMKVISVIGACIQYYVTALVLGIVLHANVLHEQTGNTSFLLYTVEGCTHCMVSTTNLIWFQCVNMPLHVLYKRARLDYVFYPLNCLSTHQSFIGAAKPCTLKQCSSV